MSSEPEPGRPLSLGHETDLADAAALLTVLRGVNDAASRHGTGETRRVLRETLWAFWEHPRLPRPLVSGKYPAAYPWSPAARAIYAQSSARPAGGWGLVIEHVVPRRLLLDQLVLDADTLEAESLIPRLEGGLRSAVVTREEDRQLTRAGLLARMPADAAEDPWARYRAVGFHPVAFAPVEHPAVDR